MKYFAVLLSLYMVLLSGFPCCTIDNCPDKQALTGQHNDQQREEGCGTCSPFFNCSTCGVFFIPADIVASSCAHFSLLPAIQKQYTSAMPVSMAGRIWQPPRVA